MTATFLRMGALAVVVGCVPAPAPPSAPDLVIAPLGDAGTSPAPAGIRFGHPPAVVRSSYQVGLHARSQGTEYFSDYRVEVLEVAAGAASQISVYFLRNIRAAPTPIDGQHYVVDSRPPHVRTPEGAPVPAEEADLVLDILPELGTRDRIDQAMPDDALQIGGQLDGLASAILSVLHPRAWKLEAGTATLRAATTDDATFDVTIAASASDVRMQVQGEARVRRSDSRLTWLELKGSYTTAQDRGTIEVTRALTSDPATRSGR